jgi:hypothetical protein
MKRRIGLGMGVVASAVMLALPGGASANTQWICTVDGVPTVFVSAGDAAHDGLTQANSKAGRVFETQFGEVDCHIE